MILAAALGAIVGDNDLVLDRAHAGHAGCSEVLRGQKQKRLSTGGAPLPRRGGYLIIVGRFIPGGRTAVTLAAGTLEYPWRKFLLFDLIAGVIWASYAALLGYFGGKTFEDNPLAALVLAFGIALVVAGARRGAAGIRRRRAAGPNRSRQRQTGSPRWRRSKRSPQRAGRGELLRGDQHRPGHGGPGHQEQKGRITFWRMTASIGAFAQAMSPDGD